MNDDGTVPYFDDVKTNNEKADMILRDCAEALNKELFKSAKKIANLHGDKDIREFCMSAFTAVSEDHEYNIKHNERSPLNMKKGLTTISAIEMYNDLINELKDRNDNGASLQTAEIISTVAVATYAGAIENYVHVIACDKNPHRIADMLDRDKDLLTKIGVITNNRAGLYVNEDYFKSAMKNSGLGSDLYEGFLNILNTYCNTHNKLRSYLRKKIVADEDVDIMEYQNAGGYSVYSDKAIKVLDDCIYNRRQRLSYKIFN